MHFSAVVGLDLTPWHRQYQLDLALFLEEILYLYNELLIDLEESVTLIRLIDAVANHLGNVAKLNAMQVRFGLDHSLYVCYFY
jgi:hypothetical protein